MSIERTYGQIRIRCDHNPSGNPQVDELKTLAAQFIDEVRRISEYGSDELVGETRRLKALAMTDVESASMWAVKATTTSR